MDNLKKTTKKARNRHVDLEAMKLAFEAIKSGMSIRKAAAEFDIPRQTIQSRLKTANFDTPTVLGPKPFLSLHEEETLAKWCQDLMKCGFPLKMEDLLNTVQKIIKDDNRKTPFKDDRPGRTWFRQFLKRNPTLSLRVAEGISKGRAIVTEETIKKWFADLQSFINESGNSDIFQDPSRILNGDETSFSMCPKTGKVLASKGYKNVYQVELGNSKETITVLLVFSADGKILPPMVVFPYLRPSKELVQSMNKNWLLGKTESGWMRSETFYEYIANGLDPWLDEMKITRPVILFVDGHKSHLSWHLSEFCDKKKIILYSLPPNTTHLTQPADVSVFRPLKQDWKKTVREWQMEHPNKSLTKVEFSPLLEKAISKNMNMETTIKNGFRKCGLYPLNPDAINFEACVQNNIRKLNENPAQPDDISLQDFDVAQKVITKLASQFDQAGLNSEIILNIIQNAANDKKKLTDIVPETMINSAQVLENIDTNSIISINTEFQELENRIQILDNVMIKPADESNILIDTLPADILFNVNEDGTLNRADEDDQNVNLQPLETSFGSDLLGKLSSQIFLENITSTPKSCFSTSSVSKLISPSFTKHLAYPSEIKSGKRRTLQKKLPHAISSLGWRKIYEEKENIAKEKRIAIEKRKIERQNKQSQKQIQKRKRKIIVKVEKKDHRTDNIKRNRKATEKCQECLQDCISDVEDEGEKNIGCDRCIRWFHLKCTTLNLLSYEDAMKLSFVCQKCPSTSKD